MTQPHLASPLKKLLPFLLAAFLLSACVPTEARTPDSGGVYYAGEQSETREALSLAGIAPIDDLSKAGVIVLDGRIPDAAAIRQQVENGAGLVLILGEKTSVADLQTLLGRNVNLTRLDEPLSLVEAETRQAVQPTLLERAQDFLQQKNPTAVDAVKPDRDPLNEQIIWNGAPQIRERFRVDGLASPAKMLVTGYETKEGVLWEIPAGTLAPTSGSIYLLSAWLTPETNPQIQEWGYFNYLIYSLVERAGRRSPLSFADFPASPVPHQQNRTGLLIFLAVELVVFFGAFIIIRRWSLRHPEALDSIVADKSKFINNEATTDWEKVGFHRPLSGLLVGMGIGIILFIPLIIYQNLILPQFILPSAQALGMWGRVTQFFGLTWALFDLGTSVAAMKYLSQYRVSDPGRGMKYVQVYLWWQALSGAVQVAIVVVATSLGIVRTPYALFAWSIIMHTMIQIPGFYGVFRTTLNGLQRNDYARYLDAAWAIVWPVLTQLALVPVFYAWGKAHPELGRIDGRRAGAGSGSLRGGAVQLPARHVALPPHRLQGQHSFHGAF